MSETERKYREHYASLSGQEKVARTLSLFEEIYSMLRRRVLSENGDLSEDDVRLKIAEALYRTDSVTQHLLGLVKR